MRNGNEDILVFNVKAIKSSYPTYEEWKLNLGYFVNFAHLACSYPTYEEWKLKDYKIYC